MFVFAITMIGNVSVHARTAQCSGVYTTQLVSIFSSSPKLSGFIKPSKINQIPGNAILMDRKYKIKMSFSKTLFQADVYSAVTGKLIKTSSMGLHEASTFEQAKKIALARFTLKTGEKFRNQEVFLFYSCVMD